MCPREAAVSVPDKDHLQAGRQGLEDGGDSPCPVIMVSQLVCTECSPCCNNATEIPGTVVNCGVNRTVLGMDKLRNKKRRSSVSDGHTKTNEETGRSE